MASIINFKKTRRDGKVIDESMTAAQMISLGWKPEKVVELNWSVDGKEYSYKGEYGLLAIVVPNRRKIAVLKESDSSGLNSSLLILDANNYERINIENQVPIGDKIERGIFSWFELAKNSSPDYFGVVFQLDKDESMVQVDIDAASGDVDGVYQLR